MATKGTWWIWPQSRGSVTPVFLDTLAKGNRVLFRLRAPGQMSQVALLVYEHNLQFTFTRVDDRINLILFSGPAVTALPPVQDGSGL